MTNRKSGKVEKTSVPRAVERDGHVEKSLQLGGVSNNTQVDKRPSKINRAGPEQSQQELTRIDIAHQDTFPEA